MNKELSKLFSWNALINASAFGVSSTVAVPRLSNGGRLAFVFLYIARLISRKTSGEAAEEDAQYLGPSLGAGLLEQHA